METLPLPVPEEGDNVHQDCMPAIVQLQSVVRPKFTLPALQFTLNVDCETVIVHPSWVTVTEAGRHPEAERVMVADLELQDVLVV